ncbi:MAG: FHA domain-containing protein, partial [Elusimicrobia bacterium]|nr:FHA domain-containing protein [Elusimicrobiota bacterium]
MGNKSNIVVINDEAASARHALIELTDGSWWIQDEGSTNGTVLNGSRLARRERMH